MAVAARRNQRKHFYVGFIGNGEVTEDNASDLLDNNLLPNDAAVTIHSYVPTNLKRTQKGLKIVEHLLDETFGLDPVAFGSEQAIVEQLVKIREADENYDVTLVVLFDEQDGTVSLVEQAIGAGIQVKDLCAALDDIELADPEPEPPAETPAPKQRGKARGTTSSGAAEATVEGPATVVPISQVHGGDSPVTHGQLLEAAIRKIVREELNMAGLSIGHNAFTEVSEQDRKIQDKVRAFVTEDGEYELAPEGQKRAPRGKKTVELTQDQAKEVGLVEDED